MHDMDFPTASNIASSIAEHQSDTIKTNGKPGKPKKRKNKPPPYKIIKTNKVAAKFANFKCKEDNECKCRPDDEAPCSMGGNCYNAMVNIECDPKLCSAGEKCQNQNFTRGEQYKFQLKMTESKGYGLYAEEEIPVGKFIVEYIGEVIDYTEFDRRFSRAIDNKVENYYFLSLGKKMYIDSAVYGNEARFINHSCDPNAEAKKWTVVSNGYGELRVGLFAMRKILPVSIPVILFCFYCSYLI